MGTIADRNLGQLTGVGQAPDPARPRAAPAFELPVGILQTSLLLETVTTPELAEVHDAPVSLAVGLQEFVLLDGLSVRGADQLLRLAATLRRPSSGRIFHWGRDLFALSRRALYPWRGRLAFVSPFQSLLPRLTVLDNVTLSQTLTSPQSAVGVARRHRPLLEQLGLRAYLDRYPRELPLRHYHLALWARELIKEPRLILGVLDSPEEPFGGAVLAPYLLPVLEKQHQQNQSAVVLAGPHLEWARPVADRFLLRREDRWQEQPWIQRRHQPLINSLKLL